MRFFRILTSVICLLAAASAAEIKIKVVDPQSAVVAGAQVMLMPQGSTTPVAVVATSAEGLAVFRGVGASSYRVRVLAPGFAGGDQRYFAVQRNGYGGTSACSGGRNRRRDRDSDSGSD